MKVLSVNVGRPREIPWRGTVVRTSIFKEPVPDRRFVSTLNIDGDEQSDLSVHGGVDKAVYVYPSEHYLFWRAELPDVQFPWGAFGENFTTDGLVDEQVNIGDRFRVGTAEFVVTQPRMPCYKLNLRFGRPDMTKRFHASGRNGFYLAVLREGEIGTGDAVEMVAQDDAAVSVADVVKLYVTDGAEQDLLRRAVKLSSLPANWVDYFRERLMESNP